MKKLILMFQFVFCIVLTNYGQESPNLKLTGSKPSFSKGTIDTEVLSAIIQKKQQEIKQRVFRNTIIKQFNKYSFTERLNNFTTYNYLYNLMDVLTSGKNKTVMTKSILESSAEFAFVYGLILYTNSISINDSKVTYESPVNAMDAITLNTKELTDFNIKIDMCLDILLENENDFLNFFKFKESLSNSHFKAWYENDNKYLKALKSDPNLKLERDTLKLKIETFLGVAEQVEDLTNDLQTVLIDNNIDGNLVGLMDSILFLDDNEFENKAKELETDSIKLFTGYRKNQLQNIKAGLNYLKDQTDGSTESLIHLLNFYKGLEKSRFKDFTMTEDQYYAMKYILVYFIDQSRNQYVNNDVIASVLDYLLENTLVEFKSLEDSNSDVSNDISSNKNGYLYVDIESLILSVDSNLGNVKNKGVLNYVSPFFSIGTNYASFNGDNTLTTDASGNPSTLSNLYFASEKIGIKWKVWNWKYTHSFKPGETFNYHWYRRRAWRRPQQEPLLNDIYIMGFGSGLLYNLVDVKSDDEFNAAIFGVGMGITFFNGLSLNVSLASPLIDKKLNNGFLSIGLDIPIIEYISALSNTK